MKTCTIIASGNSLRDNPPKLEGFVICVNFSCFHFPHDIVVALDDPRPLGLVVPNLHTNIKYGVGVGWIQDGWSPNICRRGGHFGNLNGSLAFAIQIALNLGFKDIHVWGADNKVDKYVHFYDTEEATYEQRKHYNEAFKRFRNFEGVIERSLRPGEKITYHR